MRLRLLIALAMFAWACGGEESTTTTAGPPATTAAASTSATVPPTTSTTIPATTTTSEPPFVSPYSLGDQHPVSPVIVPEDWDAAFTAVPNVIVRDGEWLMFYAGDGGRRVPSQLGLATSTDGTAWVKDPDAPFFDPGDLGWVLVWPDEAQWVMYYVQGFSVGYRDVFRATAPSARGPWTEEGIAFMAPGTEWDFRIVPTGLTKVEDTWFMTYAGFDRSRTNPVIGLLTSNDGLTWEAREGPILRGTPGRWDEYGVVPANVLETPEGLEMWYLGFDRRVAIDLSDDFATIKMGRLVSIDGGETWLADHGGQPIADTGERGWPGVTVVYREGTYFIFGGDDLGGAGIFLVTGTIP